MSKKDLIKELLETTDLTYEEIGNKAECTKQYVSQIAKEFGLTRYKKLSSEPKPQINKSFIAYGLNATDYTIPYIPTSKNYMSERLYQPDFSCIFGKKYANAFLYGQVDSLIWPIFTDVEMSSQLKNLLELKNNEGRKLFYCRKISIEDEKVELKCSNIDLGLIQAMEIGRDYGISNSDVVTVVKKQFRLFKGILSFNLAQNNDLLEELKKIEKVIEVVGIVLYPSFIKLDLADTGNNRLKELLSYCKEKDYFIKIDIGNGYFPGNQAKFTSHEKIKTFLSNYPNIIIILSGLDISGDFNLYYQLVKYYNNLWIEIDPRSFGGMTPTDCFSQLFKLKGFVQNCWHRILIGSATPTLEISQMVRGFLEATHGLNNSQQCILRTWSFRNINRLNPSNLKPISDEQPELFNKIIEIKQNKKIENDNEVNLVYKVKLRSFSITQLLFITDLIKDILTKALKIYPKLQNGEILIRSYHTTTSLIVNEHEYGNYLDLHYKFAEESRQDSSEFLHTVKALENRADFNAQDHQLASTYGSRQLTLPIIDRNLEIGGRENFYILVTFGPRTFHLSIRVKFYKE
jgi:thiamine phosphate synthase YjbQ (UPF0047 family)